MATLQLSAEVRNARLDALEIAIGPSPILELRSGALPENCASPSSGMLLARGALPVDWLGEAEEGIKSKAGNWVLKGLDGIPDSNIGHFRIYASSNPATCFVQGDVTGAGNGGAMVVDNALIRAGQIVAVLLFELIDGNS